MHEIASALIALIYVLFWCCIKGVNFKMTNSTVRVSSTRRERLESRETAILDAAHQTFDAKGFVKATITEIAQEAGVAEGTVYLYFNNKQALASGVVARFYAFLTDTARNGVAQYDTFENKLTFLANHHLEHIVKERRMLELLQVLDRDREGENLIVYELNKKYVAIFDEVIREGTRQGLVSDKFQIWVLRDIFYGSLEYAMRTILMTGREKQLKKFVKQMMMVFSTGAVSQANPGIISQPKKTTELNAVLTRLETVADRLEKVKNQ